MVQSNQLVTLVRQIQDLKRSEVVDLECDANGIIEVYTGRTVKNHVKLLYQCFADIWLYTKSVKDQIT